MHNLTKKCLSLQSMSSSDPEKPEPENAEKDAESRATPETYTCNGSASRKACKHQSKRDQLEREKELLKRQQETPNQEEECQDSGTEGEDTNTELKPARGQQYLRERLTGGWKLTLNCIWGTH